MNQKQESIMPTTTMSMAQQAILAKYDRKTILADLTNQLANLGDYKKLMLQKLIGYMTAPTGHAYSDLINKMFLGIDVPWDRVIDDVLLLVASQKTIDLSQLVNATVHLYGSGAMPYRLNIAANAILAMSGVCYRNNRGGNISKYVCITSLMTVSDDIRTRLAVCERKPPVLDTPRDVVGTTTNNGGQFSVMLGSKQTLPDDMTTINLPIDDINVATRVPLALSDLATILPLNMTSKQQESDDLRMTMISHLKYSIAVRAIMADVMANGNEFYIQAVIDYRGRLNSSCSALSYQGNKSVKPLIHFHKKELVSEEGLLWLKVHVANCADKDKLDYVDRLAWVDNNDSELENIAGDNAYMDAVYEYRKVQEGKPTGIRVGVDFTNSGYQLIAILTGCLVTANATNLLGGSRKDLYTECMDRFNTLTGSSYDRKGFKDLMIPVAYGSTSCVKDLSTRDRKVFWGCLSEKAPGFMKYRDMLIDLWDPKATSYTIKTFDGYTFHFPVFATLEEKVVLTAFENRSMTYQYKAKQPIDTAVKLVSCVTHACDAAVVREIRARAGYDIDDIVAAMVVLKALPQSDEDAFCEDFVTYKDAINLVKPTPERVRDMLQILNECLTHECYEIVTEFDDISSHANYAGNTASHATMVYAQLAASNALQDMLRDITKNRSITYKKVNDNSVINMSKTIMEKAVYHIT